MVKERVAYGLGLFAWAAIAMTISFARNLDYLLSAFLFWLPPAIYLTYKVKRAGMYVFIFAVIATLTFGILIDYTAMRSGIWHVPHSVFPFRILGIVPAEDLVWSILFIYTSVMSFEYLTPTQPYNPLNRRFAITFMLVCGLTALGYWVASRGGSIPAFYGLAGCTLFLLPLITFLLRFKRYFASFIATALFIIPLSFMHEVTGSILGYWTFPAGSYVGMVGMGGTHIPYEEFLFYVLLGSISFVMYYLVLFRNGLEESRPDNSD